ncbi:MAG TPA: DUF1566 domain-containing protein, partial [Labilithrix sp.]|nr:DUF1566 domain-containing protein [Labilithrix sp.]
EFFAGSSNEAGGGASVSVVGARGGGHVSSLKQSLNRDGDAERCQASSSKDERPPEGCGALVRIEVVPIGENAEPTCPEGSSYNGTECVRTKVLTVTQCPANSRWDGKACREVPQPSTSGPDAVGESRAPGASALTPQGRFALVSDGVEDGRSHLLWARRDAPRPTGWNEARAYCAKQGMRLPSQQELSELVDSDPSVGALALDRSAHYWSSSQWTAGSIRYLAVNASTGDVRNEFDDERFRVRCVRTL